MPLARPRLTQDWWLPRLTARTALLLPFALVFGRLVATRRWLYQRGVLPSTKLSVPVVVVGNLTLGGSGKTPLVIALVRHLREHGFRPGVISRGYRRDADVGADAARSAIEVAPADRPTRTGDEPLLISRATGVPVFVDADRVRAGRALLSQHPEVNVLISDDGLQHYALARDIEIAVFDERGAGNGWLLPAGPLREPLIRATGLTALVANDSGDNGSMNGLHQRFPEMHSMRLVPQACYRLTDPRQTCALAMLGGQSPSEAPPARPTRAPDRSGPSSPSSPTAQRIAGLAGIGNPARFFSTLRAAGLSFDEHAFPDHHAYTAADLMAIDADTLIMTEKDALKCSQYNDQRIWVLPVTAQVGAALFELILEKLRGPQAA